MICSWCLHVLLRLLCVFSDLSTVVNRFLMFLWLYTCVQRLPMLLLCFSFHLFIVSACVLSYVCYSAHLV